MSICPGRKRGRDQRSLEADTNCIKHQWKIKTVISLVESRELKVMECEGMEKALDEKGIKWIHYPLRDKWIPPNTQEFLTKAVKLIINQLLEGKRVLVHCNGGKGRTGLVIGAVLMSESIRKRLGRTSRLGIGEVIRDMRRVRPGMLTNPLQQAYLMHIWPALANL
mmetsp:Transcript_20805/g.32953  ORF Transcript_20805/g.32953 Transcript_20805/m.32953 type:complete len:166 (-) Transcript_20805:14-511(-)